MATTQHPARVRTPAHDGGGTPADSPGVLPGAGPGGGGGGGRPARRNPADRTQLARHPVSPRRIAALFAPHRGTIALVVVLITASSVVNLAQPFLVRGVIDDALPGGDTRLLVLLTASMVGVAALTSVIGVVQTWMATAMGQQVMHALRVQLFTHLQAQSLGFFTRTRGGEVQSRLTHDIAGMQSVVTSSATGVASNLTTAVATAVAMVALSPAMSLVSLVVLPPAIWLSRRVALIRRDVTDERQRELAALHTQVEEGLSVSGVRLAKTLGTTARDAERFTERSDRLVGLELRSQLAGRWRMATMQIVFAAIPAVIYLAAGFPATSGGMTIGTLVAFTALQGTIFRPVMGLLNIGVQWVSALAFCWPIRTPPTPSCGPPWAPRASPTPSPGCRMGWTPWSARAATASPAGSSSAWPSPGPCCATRPCWSSTRPPARWTTPPRRRSRRPSTGWPPAARP